MAINTAEKRKAISGIPVLAAGVTPNVVRDQDWRFEVARTYIGYRYGIDNAEDRRVAAALPFLPVGVMPDASKGLQWRSAAGWGYLFTHAVIVGLATLSDAAPWLATAGDLAYERATVEDDPL